VVGPTIPALHSIHIVGRVALGALPLGALAGWVALGRSCPFDLERRTLSTHAPVRVVAPAAWTHPLTIHDVVLILHQPKEECKSDVDDAAQEFSCPSITSPVTALKFLIWLAAVAARRMDNDEPTQIRTAIERDNRPTPNELENFNQEKIKKMD